MEPNHDPHTVNTTEYAKKSIPLPFILAGLVVYAIVYFLITRGNSLSPGRDTIFLLLGLCIGVWFCVGDVSYFYKYYAFDLTSFNQKFVTRSLLFLLSYIPLGFLIISSSGSTFGAGIILGMGAYLSQEMWMYRDDYQAFKKKYLFQLARELTVNEFWWSVRGFIAIVGIFSLLTFA